jgi:hypothetical protein
MHYFRNMQELENTDITRHPAFNNLSDENRRKVAETYTNVFNNNQGRMGIKIAQGIAFETAKRMCEGFDASPGTIADEGNAIVDTKVSSPGYHRESEKPQVDTPYKNSWADQESRRDKTGVHPLAPKDNSVTYKMKKESQEGDQASNFQERNDALVGMTEGQKKKKSEQPVGSKSTKPFLKGKATPKDMLNMGEAEEAAISAVDPEEDGAAKLLRLNHDAKCMNCGAVHPFDVVCFNGRSHSEAGAAGASSTGGAGDILKQNHTEKGMKVEYTDPEISAAARYLTNRAKVSGLMESVEDAKDIQKKNLEDKCPNCGCICKDGVCPNCKPKDDDDDKKGDDKKKDDELDEKYYGFGKLAKKVGSPALAAYIGRKKYGKDGFNTHKHKGEVDEAEVSESEIREALDELWSENYYPVKPLEEHCGNCCHPQSYHSSVCMTCECQHFTTEVNESKKKDTCFCGHGFGDHGKGGCRVCKKEGYMAPGMAAHQPRKGSYAEKFESEYAQIFAAQQGKINTAMSNAATNWLPEELELKEGNGYDDIGPGDHVKFNHPLRGSDKVPQQGKGKVVMKGPHGWVLNTGGKHGTPGIVSRDNYVSHRKAKKKVTEEIQESSKFSPEAVAASKKAWKATTKARNSQSIEDHEAAAQAHKTAALTHAPGSSARGHHDQAEVHTYLAGFTKKHGPDWTKNQPQGMKEEEVNESESSYHDVLTNHGYSKTEDGDHLRYEHKDTSHVNLYKGGDWQHKGKNKSLVGNTGSDPKSLNSHLKRVASQKKAGANRKERDGVMRDMGLNKVRGSVSGKTYWESEEKPGTPLAEETDSLMAASLSYINHEVSRSGGKLFKITEEDMKKPPNLRESSGKENCGNCAYFNGSDKCNMYNGYPVDANDLCDEYVAGTPGTKKA